MSTQYRLVQSGKTASGGCSAGQGSSEPVAPRIFFLFLIVVCDAMNNLLFTVNHNPVQQESNYNMTAC
jgi:hypothetical protein